MMYRFVPEPVPGSRVPSLPLLPLLLVGLLLAPGCGEESSPPPASGGGGGGGGGAVDGGAGGLDTVSLPGDSQVPDTAPAPDGGPGADAVPPGPDGEVPHPDGGHGPDTAAADGGPGGDAGPPPVEILSFRADPEDVAAGAEVTLSWETAGATTVAFGPPLEVDPGLLSGQVTVVVDETTTWTLTARGPGGEATAQATVTVHEPPVIERFAADPEAIVAGQETVLRWSVAGGDGVVSLAPDVGLEPPLPREGEVTVAPPATTTYTLTAEGIGGRDTAEVTVTVYPVPVVDRFLVDPSEVPRGALATLRWETTGAREVTVVPSVSDGPLPPDGEVQVSPAETTTYTLTARGPGGEATAEATLTVHQPPVIEVFVVEPAEVVAGNGAILRWETRWARAVFLDPPLPEPGLDPALVDGEVEVRPFETTTYTLTAEGPGGAARAEVTLTVHHPPVIDLFVFDPPEVPEGRETTLRWQTTNATEVALDPPVEGFDPSLLNGELVFVPAASGTYTLVARGPGGEARAEARIGVLPRPVVPSFTATPGEVAAGAAVRLAWEAEHADTVSIAPPPEGQGGVLPPRGALDVFPFTTTTYTLTATGRGGTAIAEVLVTVHEVPEILSFTATPLAVRLGTGTELAWRVQWASQVEIRGLPEGVAIPPDSFEGRVRVPRVLEETTFTLRASNPAGGTSQARVTVSLLPEPVIVTFAAEPGEVVHGHSVDLVWQVEHADEVVITGVEGVVDLGGADVAAGRVAVTPPRDAAYTLEAIGPGGEAIREIEVVVRPAPLLLSEVMYNPQGVDNGAEWVEIYNAGDVPVDLRAYSLGAGGSSYGEQRFSLRGTIGPRGCFLVGGPGGVPAGVQFDQVLNFDGRLQNGGNAGADAVGLFFGDTRRIPELRPISAVIYGWPENLNNLPDEVRSPGDVDVAQAANGTSIERLTSDRDSPWIVRPLQEPMTPGRCLGVLRVKEGGITPSSGPATGGTVVVLRGGGFVGEVRVTFGDQEADCAVDSPERLTCVVPPLEVGRHDVVVAANGGAVTVPRGFVAWAEGGDLDWCNIQHPKGPIRLSLSQGGSVDTPDLYGQVFEAGITPLPGAYPTILAEAGYGPEGTDPRTDASWTWQVALHNEFANAGPNDEYMTRFTFDRAGTRSWAYRFSNDGGLHWIFCDTVDGNPGFDPAAVGTIVVEGVN